MVGWLDTLFGYWGLPLMLALANGVIFGFWVLLISISIWGLMFGYSFVKFSDKKKQKKECKK